MANIDIEHIRKKSVSGVVALTTRTFVLQIIAFAATFLLTIFLSPANFGVFYLVSATIAFLTYFSDIGLAAALVQKKEEVSRQDLTTTFIIQQVLVVFLVLLSLVLAPHLGVFLKLDDAGVWLFRALAVAFFLSSLKTIPSVILERKLAFDRLVIPQIVETVGFYGVAVTLAWMGYGVTSFTWAVLTRGVLGLVAIYIAQPWVPQAQFSMDSAYRLMRFGVPFQLNSFLGLLKDDLLTFYLGTVLPVAQIGYIGWAKKWAEVPLRLIMDSVIRVTFPAFSRLQHDKALLVRAVEKAIYGLSLTILPISTGLLFFIGPMVHIIPRYLKWEPALTSFYFFVGAAVLAALSTPLINVANAIGKIRLSLQFMIFWTIITWASTVVLINVLGFNGFAVSLFIIGWSLVLVLREVKKFAPVVFWPQVRGALFGAFGQGIIYWFGLPYVEKSIIGLTLLGVAGGILYCALVWGLEREKIQAFIRSLRHKS